ncbi:SAM-dependent methyltransferase [Sinomonas albida]|uniref:hypothetical protein n=1 Tax=Sinomonas albida TaxID=369942 RepID=UPI0010A89E58|nr:hypothetical protein [Sinomonas albida]
MRNSRSDLRVPDAKADLYLIGLGIGGFDQRTVEVDHLLRGAAAVLHLTAFDPELREICSGQVEDLSGIYFCGKRAAEVYDAMAEHVMEVALANHVLGYSCFVTYGHPLFLVDTSWDLRRRTDLRVKPVAATSFVDQIMCDLEHRFDYGVQHYEANRFLRMSPRIDSRFPLIVSQVGEVGSDRIELRGRKLAWLTPLFEEVMEKYPNDRQCDLVFSAYRRDMAPKVSSATVGEIFTLASSVHVGTTLVVHGSESK